MPTDQDAPKLLEEKQTGTTTRVVVPTTRISDATATQNRVQRLGQSDSQRAQRRTLVKGLVDGNPPYKQSALVKAGRAHQCNVNWRTAESYLSQATGAFYDIFSETPTYATVITEYGDSDDRYSRIITEKFHDLMEQDDDWDSCIQTSQEEMVLYGDGPIWFNDADDWRTEAGLCGELLVPERAKANTSKWEESARLVAYLPHQLYERIMHEKEARAAGWDIDAVKKAIIHAHPKSAEGAEFSQWEYHQQRLKAQAFNYDGESSTIECYNYFVKEFPRDEDKIGMITHVIGLRSSYEGTTAQKYLFKSERRFANWRQLVHPMYYAITAGGFHHSVTGMGVKMYSAMEFENRLLCNLADKTFAPDAIFRPMTGAAQQSFSIARYGEYGQVSAGYDVIQIPQMRKLEDGIGFRREVQRTVAGNLSQYRQELQEPTGNPETATGRTIDAQQQARLGKTQLNRYYRQLDWLYAEKFRRAAKPGLNPNMPGAKQALEFQETCFKAGVPPAALRKIKSVRATRITGQGSEFMRQQNLEFLLGIVAMLPEIGRENLVADVIASRAGQVMVKRYFPMPAGDQQVNTDHHALATLQVGAMKEGIAPVVTGTQNSLVYAQVFLHAAAEAVAAAAQGQADPAQALAFVHLAGPAIAKHLQKLQADPSRKQAFEALKEQFKRLSQMADALTQRYQQQQAQAQKGQQTQMRAAAIQQGHDPDTQLKAAETKAKIDQSWLKTRESLAQKDMKTRQALALNDAKTAHGIKLDEAKAEHAEATAS